VRIIVLTNNVNGGSDKIAERVYNELFPAIAAAAARCFPLRLVDMSFPDNLPSEIFAPAKKS
jgi:hypothetical protein